MPIRKKDAISGSADAGSVNSSDVKDVPFFTSVFIQRAKTGRANCPACNNKIPEGEWRVGVDGIAGGRLVTVWLHPICWLTHGAAFTRNTSGRGACRVTKIPFEKGQLRFSYRIGGADSWSHVCTKGIGAVLPSVLTARPAFLIEQITGWSDLSADEQRAVRGAVENAMAGVEALERAKGEARDAGKRALAARKAARVAEGGAVPGLDSPGGGAAQGAGRKAPAARKAGGDAAPGKNGGEGGAGGQGERKSQKKRR